MIHPPVHHFIQSLADGLTCFDMYYLDNCDQWQSFLYRRGYKEQCDGGIELYENEKDFSEYPGETLFYHWLTIKDAISPQTKLTWFIKETES